VAGDAMVGVFCFDERVVLFSKDLWFSVFLCVENDGSIQGRLLASKSGAVGACWGVRGAWGQERGVCGRAGGIFPPVGPVEYPLDKWIP
jgi:hypothetical protein